jgi:pantoate--beta-alanine ligase
MQRVTRSLVAEGATIGLVPTMGCLHEGHKSLIRRAARAADAVITTIFVNPAQFGPGEDFQAYPRDHQADLKKIESSGGEILFLPRAADIYPEDFQTYVTVQELTRGLESVARPTHFRGVTTVVAKLFNITRPDIVFFGMKDYQQAMVLRQMTTDLGYPIKFVIAPTVREPGGLAMSSRNGYFTPEQRREARCLYLALITARAMVRSGITSAKRIEREMRTAITASCPSAKVDYIAFTKKESLQPVRRIENGTVCSLAVRLYGVRLIDNIKVV